jgi:hypothetical protein
MALASTGFWSMSPVVRRSRFHDRNPGLPGRRGYPGVNPELLTPDMFFAHSTHDDCPRFHYYSKHLFAEDFGDDEGVCSSWGAWAC